jgi:acetyl-CoA carboxylase biotin carboxylase subunit
MKRLFIANRGEIAARIIGTAQAAGIETAVAAPECDHGLPYTLLADEVIAFDSPRDFGSVDAVIRAATAAAADAVHPGYGFLSENAGLARACADSDILFVGPSPDLIATMGDKASAARLAHERGVPVLSGGFGSVETLAEATAAGCTIGFPVMLKAVAGGGGIGMAIAHDCEEIERVFASVSSRGQSVFRDARVLVERYVERARHVEVQVMGLPDGNVVVMAERDCSAQRRHQKIVEESPAPGLSRDVAAMLRDWAGQLAAAVAYQGAGTVEFLIDAESGEAFFLEMNTRLQVEHRITEAVHGVDLVAWQLAIAEGHSDVPPTLSPEPFGHAVEMRIYAEDSVRFLPRPGHITSWTMPEGLPGVRVDAGYALGTDVTPNFDPLLAKIVVHGATREEALARASAALDASRIEGPGNNLDFLRLLMNSSEMAAGGYDTDVVARLLRG